MKGMWVGYDVGCTMGLTLGHGAWQIDRPSNGSMWNLQFPTCWPMNGLFFHWSRGWGMLSLSERLVSNSFWIPIPGIGIDSNSNSKIYSSPAFYPSALRAGGVLSSRSGRACGCQTCGTHISVTAWWIFSIRSSVELSRPVGVHCHGHMPICPIWACPWAKNLSNLPQIGSRLCGTHISETAGWIYPI